jgi:peptide/nickel transport system substrate-binding protein
MSLRRLAAALALAMMLVAASLGGAAHAQDRVLRVSLNTELQILDPIVVTINATRVFAYMVFDTLVGIDADGIYRPQMLEGWQISDDRLTYAFTLREGLEFSDGTPVTSQDCVASIRRWAQREALGRHMMEAAEDFRIIDARRFELKLKRPFAFVIEALGKPGNQIPVIMPARLASLPASAAVPEVVGSGPFLFRRSEWRPGDRAVFDRNPRYRPRSEPASGLAGGKVVRMDRVELMSVTDQSTRAAALRTGELDYLEIVPADHIAQLRRDRNITIPQLRGLGQIMSVISINHAQPPFNDVLIRRALQAAIVQEDVMASLGLPADMVMSDCRSLYMCDAPGTTQAGTEMFRRTGPEVARQMLREAGYTNEPAVLLHAESSAVLNPIGLVVADQMRQAGFNVQVRTSDFATVAQRRFNRGPVEQGGWSVIPIIWNGIDLINPFANPGVSNNCANYYGWYCDEETTGLLRQISEATTQEARRELADKLQIAFHRNVNVVLGGQFQGPPAFRSNLQGWVPFAFPVFWNIERR